MQVRMANDRSVFIAEVDQKRYKTIGEAILLVADHLSVPALGRATLIPLVTIPVSLIGAFALMYAFDFSSTR